MAFGWFKRNKTATTPAEPRREEAAPVTFPADKVAARAYEIWVRNGQPHGRDQQNWVDAEAELRAEFAANPEPAAPIRKPR